MHRFNEAWPQSILVRIGIWLCHKRHGTFE